MPGSCQVSSPRVILPAHGQFALFAVGRMFSLVRRLFGATPPATPSKPSDAEVPVADPVVRSGMAQYDLRANAALHEGFPHPDWDGVYEWIDSLPEDGRAAAWLDCERGWLHQLREALGPHYRLHESDRAFVLTAQPPREAAATLAFVGATERRVQQMLEELAGPSDWGREILVVFEDQDDYYRYVSRFYPEEGEFAMSSGMFVSVGCGHFVVHGEDLANFEPVIAHEMTHSQLAHLPIPAWLNEGMAVNAEERLTRIGADIWKIRHLEARHRTFWDVGKIQEFWSGAAYLRPDEGNELAYDLGRVIVNGLSNDWPGFKRFAAAAHLSDSGASAAHALLGLDLGEFVRHYLGQEEGTWGPDPSAWPAAPERGQF